MQVTNLDPWLEHRDRHSDPTLIVMHSTAGGNLSGAVATLREKGFSYHYIIEKDGNITKCVPVTKIAYHAGNSYGPAEKAAGISTTQDHAADFINHCSVNPYSIGISFVNLNDGEDPITAEQLAAAEWIVGQCRKMFPSLSWVTTHYAVSPKRKTDPRLFDLDQFAGVVGLKPFRI